MPMHGLKTHITSLIHQTVMSFRLWSIYGVFVILSIVIQCVSGIMLAMSLMNDSMLVCISRSTEDMDDLYCDDFFWLHERGVDIIFIFLFFHYFRKQYLRANFIISESSWVSGSFMFLLLHGVIFTGLVLCCTHLSDITLKIAANVINTLAMKIGSLGCWIFTDETLNTDTIARIMYLHYILPFLVIFLSVDHMVDMHYGHKDHNMLLERRVNYHWYNEVIKAEVYKYVHTLWCIALFGIYVFHDNEPISYEIFMWGDIGLMTDVRYLGVAPHWYFRAYMAWLIFCPHHFIGIYGLLYLMVIIYYQPMVFMNNKAYINSLRCYQPVEYSFIYNILTAVFILSCLYVCSYLPYGRFYTSVSGNYATTFSFMYIFTYLSTPMYDVILALIEHIDYSINEYIFDCE